MGDAKMTYDNLLERGFAPDMALDAIPDDTPGRDELAARIIPTWQQIAERLHRGGAFWYLWTVPGKVSHWARVGESLPLPSGANVYWGVHPVSEIPQTNATGEPSTPKGVRAQLPYIAALNCIFSEFDAKDFPDRAACSAHVVSLDPQPSVVIDSGGGFHCYWLLSETFPITNDQDRGRADRLQKAWVDRTRGDDGAKDLARVLRVPGSRNLKPKYGPDFPTVKVIRWGRPEYRFDDLERLAVKPTTRPENTTATTRTFTRTEDIEAAERNLSRLAAWRCDDYVAWVEVGMCLSELGDDGFALWDRWSQQSQKYPGVDELRAKWETFKPGNGTGLRLATLTWWAQQDNPSGSARVSASSAASPSPGNTSQAEQGGLVTSPDIRAALERQEIGDAELLAAVFRGQLVYDHSAATWYTWGGHYWQPDKVGQPYSLVSNDVAALYLAEAAKRRKAGEGDLSDALATRARQLRNRRRVENVLYLAARPLLGITGDEWDKNPWLLGCKNGVLDLKTADFRAGQPEDFIKNASPTEWAGLDCPCPIWERFIQQIFKGDRDIIDFVQRLLGYAITGLSWEHVFPILWGDGRNGKGTLLETLRGVLGPDLAMRSESEAWMNSRVNGAGPQPFIYEMRGKRLVWASESKEGRQLDTGLIKQLAGGDTLNVRTLHSKPIAFTPSHLAILLTNHKPHIPEDDSAMWDRVLLIPFTQRFVDEPGAGELPKDPAMKDKLLLEASGILAWLVRGCLEWQRTGLEPPQNVKTATKDYQLEEDTIEQFFDEKCVRGEACAVKASTIFRVYTAWATAYGATPLSQTAFGKRMKSIFQHDRDASGNFYKGIGLLES